MPEAHIEAVHDPAAWPDTFDERQLAALALADAMSGETHALAPELIAQMREHYNEVERAELILVAGQANLNNRAGNAAKQLLGSTDSA